MTQQARQHRPAVCHAAMFVPLLLVIFTAVVRAETQCDKIHSHELCELAHGCQWLDASLHCAKENEHTPPCDSVWDDHGCTERKDCKWVPEAGFCRPHDYTLRCADITLEGECVHRAECEWSANHTVCHLKGEENIQCGQIRDATTCQARTDTCTWVAGSSTCIPKGTSAIDHCTNLLESKGCEDTGCEWEEVTQRCHRPGAPRECERFPEPTSCASDTQCEWLSTTGGGGICHRKGIAVGCSRLIDQEECKEQAHCTWNEHAMLCLREGQTIPCHRYYTSDTCPTDQCVWDKEASVCLESDATVSCGRLQLKADCSKKDHCKWYRGVCHAETDEEVDCAHITTFRDCARHHCDWIEELEECRLPVVPAPAAGQGHGDKDNAPKADPPLPNCDNVDCKDEPDSCERPTYLAKPTFECCKRCSMPTAVCSQYGSHDLCPRDTCEWHVLGHACTPLGGHVPCGHFHAADVCDASRCEWHRDVSYCNDKGTDVPCERYASEAQCAHATHCDWNDDFISCLPKGQPVPCDKYPSELDCVVQHNCVWEPTAQRCKHRATELHCNQFHTREACNIQGARCEWNADGAQCTQIHSHVLCNMLTHTECEIYDGCRWNGEVKHCEEDLHFVPLPCHEHFSEASCRREGNCTWHALAQMCRRVDEPIKCKDLHSDKLCASDSSCRWSTIGSFCFNEAEGPMCDLLYDNEACLGSKCTWDDTIHRCFKPGETRRCAQVFDEHVCKADDCEWNSHIHQCHDKNTRPECDSYFDENYCVEHTECAWGSELGICFNKESGPACGSHYNEDLCGKNEKCKYIAHLGLCVDTDSDYCSHFSDRHSCNEPGHGCGWDSWSDFCRKLDPIIHSEL
eukprot:m.179942 g.179942  ORF g.179942 m.179942 type:complete len:857 (-) comp14889_c0_seq1:88-2658(-)